MSAVAEEVPVAKVEEAGTSEAAEEVPVAKVAAEAAEAYARSQ